MQQGPELSGTIQTHSCVLFNDLSWVHTVKARLESIDQTMWSPNPKHVYAMEGTDTALNKIDIEVYFSPGE